MLFWIAEEIVGKLREAEIVLSQGACAEEAYRRTLVSEQTYDRWREEYGVLKTDQARRMKDLEGVVSLVRTRLSKMEIGL